MSTVKVFVSVRDRAKNTRECIGGLLATEPGRLDISIYDMGSRDEIKQLRTLYDRWLSSGAVKHVSLFWPEALQGVYWTKNYAWTLFLAQCAALPEGACEYAVMVDNDVVPRQPWLDTSLAVLNSKLADEKKIAVVSPYDGNPVYEENDRADFMGFSVSIRRRLVSRFWIARLPWWTSFPPPPSCAVMRHGKPDRVPTDNWYYEPMRERGEVFGVISPARVTDPDGLFVSARKTAMIGADCTTLGPQVFRGR